MDGQRAHLVIEDQKYNNLLLPSRVYIVRSDGAALTPLQGEAGQTLTAPPQFDEPFAIAEGITRNKAKRRNASSSSRNNSTDSCSEVKMDQN